MPDPDQTPKAPEASYWSSNLRLLIGLLVVWFAASFGLGILLVEPLNRVKIGGFPLGFWFAQQGSILVFIVLIFVYARAMDRVDTRYRRDREQPDPAKARSRVRP